MRYAIKFLILLFIGQSLSFPDYSFGPSNGNFQSFYPGDHDPTNLQEENVEPIHVQHSYFDDEDFDMNELKFQPIPEEESGVETVDKSNLFFTLKKGENLNEYYFLMPRLSSIFSYSRRGYRR